MLYQKLPKMYNFNQAEQLILKEMKELAKK